MGNIDTLYVPSESPKKVYLRFHIASPAHLSIFYVLFLASPPIWAPIADINTSSVRSLQDDMGNVDPTAIRYLYSCARQRRREWTLFPKNRHVRLRCRWQGWHRALGLRKRSKAESDHREYKRAVCFVTRSLFVGLLFVSSGSVLIENFSTVSIPSSLSDYTPFGLAILILSWLGSATDHRPHTTPATPCQSSMLRIIGRACIVVLLWVG